MWTEYRLRQEIQAALRVANATIMFQAMSAAFNGGKAHKQFQKTLKEVTDGS